MSALVLAGCKKNPPAVPVAPPVPAVVVDAGTRAVARDAGPSRAVTARVEPAVAGDAGARLRADRPLPPRVARLIPDVPREPDKGDVVVVYKEPTDEDYQYVLDRIKASGAYEQVAAELNKTFQLPSKLTISFESCGEENAFYSSDNRSITMCYELIDKYYKVFKEKDASEEEDTRVLLNAGMSAFFHELGHAFVDLMKLPVTGKEEDAVDGFSMVVLMQSGENGEDAALAAVDQFAVDADEDEKEGLDKMAFWDEHSLSIQRYYDMSCLIYGSDPEKFASLVGSQGLPEERAEQCTDEYNQTARSWDTLLAPHFKPGFVPSDRHLASTVAGDAGAEDEDDDGKE